MRQALNQIPRYRPVHLIQNCESSDDDDDDDDADDAHADDDDDHLSVACYPRKPVPTLPWAARVTCYPRAGVSHVTLGG